MDKNTYTGRPIKLSPIQKSLLLNLQGGCVLMWSYKEACFWRYDGRWTTKVLKKAANALFEKRLVAYEKTCKHEGQRVEAYRLTELGKTITP